jgi:hypothetical protein
MLVVEVSQLVFEVTFEIPLNHASVLLEFFNIRFILLDLAHFLVKFLLQSSGDAKLFVVVLDNHFGYFVFLVQTKQKRVNDVQKVLTGLVIFCALY